VPPTFLAPARRTAHWHDLGGGRRRFEDLFLTRWARVRYTVNTFLGVAVVWLLFGLGSVQALEVTAIALPHRALSVRAVERVALLSAQLHRRSAAEVVPAVVPAVVGLLTCLR
jgi:hypothetical protein